MELNNHVLWCLYQYMDLATTALPPLLPLLSFSEPLNILPTSTFVSYRLPASILRGILYEGASIFAA